MLSFRPVVLNVGVLPIGGAWKNLGGAWKL